MQKPDISSVCRVLECIRAERPLVLNLTNHVVQEITANLLLAVGASPAMMEHPEEAAELAAVANATLVNVGTLKPLQMDAMCCAVAACRKAGRPWVLDPVAVGIIGVRTRFAREELLALRPAIIRGNASEINGLAGCPGTSRGADSGELPEAAIESARALAAQTGAAVLTTGPVDFVCASADAPLITCSNGHPLMTRVTGVGCAQGALAAACVAVEPRAEVAALAAAVILAVAGEIAAERAPRPGSFATALLDALDALDAPTLTQRARCSIL